VCERALFVLDENGVIFWSYVSPIGVNPGADGILRALGEMQQSRQQQAPQNQQAQERTAA
jgi:alkyl hydroperoxide reductase subunit AhpC